MKAEAFGASQWAALFKRAGARHAFLTSNFHDGYCLWPSPYSPGWNSMDVGPKRDVPGEFSAAMREAGLRAGFYHSIGEFNHPLYQAARVKGGDLKPFVREHFQPQLREVVKRYRPSFICFDGEWEFPMDSFEMQDFLAWLYNNSPCKDGDWLRVNGEAIRGTRRWTVSHEWPRVESVNPRLDKTWKWTGTTRHPLVHYTRKGDAVYAICLAWPGKTLRLEHPAPTPQTQVRLLGHSQPLRWKACDKGISIDLPQFAPDRLPCRNAWTFNPTRLNPAAREWRGDRRCCQWRSARSSWSTTAITTASMTGRVSTRGRIFLGAMLQASSIWMASNIINAGWRDSATKRSMPLGSP